MKIAIIGTGISGLGAAHYLAPYHDITVYEKNVYIGGHSRTISVDGMPVDTGFIVFNKRNYPYLTRLFEELNVPVQKSDMSFGASIANGWMEYGSKGMFAQKRNLLRLAYWQMLHYIIRFNKEALRYLNDDRHLTLEQALDELKMGDWFRYYYLQAMGAAIWSCSVETILKFPAKTFVRFFHNHGLLTVNDHPQWYTVTGGSREYIRLLTKSFKDRIRLNCPVEKVERKKDKIIVNGEAYDQALFACHADQALALLDKPTKEEQEILGAFTYQDNKIIVHGDTSFMPQRKKAWASWVYLSEKMEDENESVSLTYWMNNLQGLDPEKPVFVTLNSSRRPEEDLIYDEHTFRHPVFTQEAIDAQRKIVDIQGTKNCFYCGAYQLYGFHEDGLSSAIRAVERMKA